MDPKTLSEQSDIIAHHFAIRYYKTIDSRDTAGIERLYAPDARITWNGTPLQVGPTLQQFWQSMPDCVSEVQTLDAHPLPKANEMSPLIINMSVSGRQAHYDAASTERLINKPAVPLESAKGKSRMGEAEIDQLPRTFHQSFVLAPATDPQGQVVVNPEGKAIYIARSDAFRFVA